MSTDFCTLKPVSELPSESHVLVEGPSWGDAGFFGRWLLTAAKVNELLQQAKRDDPDFHRSVDNLEILRTLDFGIMAIVFVSQFADKEFYTFVIDIVSSEDLIDFALMVEMGFFVLTGDRYQMTLPPTIDLETVKQAHLKLARTEDDDWIHPERLVRGMSYTQARKYQHLLGKMDQDQRLAARQALLRQRFQ